MRQPLANARVRSPLTISGDASVFEANLIWQLTDTAGRVIVGGITTATAGAPQRGTFTITATYTDPPSDMIGFAEVFTRIVEQEGWQPADRYHAFIAVLDRDAQDARAAVQLVLAQASISSQPIDNLNASIHVRALLTDLFLIDEIVRPQGITEGSKVL